MRILISTLCTICIFANAQTQFQGVTNNGIVVNDGFQLYKKLGLIFAHRADTGVILNGASNVATWIDLTGNGYNAFQNQTTNMPVLLNTTQFATNILGGPLKGIHFSHVPGTQYLKAYNAAKFFSGNTTSFTYIVLISGLTNFNGATAIGLGNSLAPPIPGGSTANRLEILPNQAANTTSLNYRSSTNGTTIIAASIGGGLTNRAWYLSFRYDGNANFQLGRNLVFQTNQFVISATNIDRQHDMFTYGTIGTTNVVASAANRAPCYIMGDWLFTNLLSSTSVSNVIMELDSAPYYGFNIFTKPR